MTIRLTLEDRSREILDGLRLANDAFSERYAGEPRDRQPTHVVYGGAHTFRAELPRRMGKDALDALDAHAPDAFSLARALAYRGADGVLEPTAEDEARLTVATQDPLRARREDPSAWLAARVYERVREKLTREPVEDFRIDFEDGFGVRTDEEEDRFALEVAAELRRTDVELPPFLGVRIKPLNEEYKARALRTLDLVLTHADLGPRANRGASFFVTLPKVTSAAQVAAASTACDLFEERLGLPRHALRIELMIELTQSVFAADGRLLLPALVDAGRGRVSGAHFGTYDYTACNAITAAYQGMEHPACQHALQLMKLAYANTEIFLSDGATNVLPVPVHRGADLSDTERAENRAAVHRAWRISAANIQRSLSNGYFQGWDMHAAQLVPRYAATFAFFLSGFDAAAERLRIFLSKAKEATLLGDVFDDAATGQALLSFFLRAEASGAVSAAELEETGLRADELASRSFKTILRGRTQG